MRVSAVVVGESTQDMVKVIFAQQPQREEAFYRYLRHWLGNRITCHSARKRNISTPCWQVYAWAMPLSATRALKAGLHLRG